MINCRNREALPFPGRRVLSTHTLMTHAYAGLKALVFL